MMKMRYQIHKGAKQYGADTVFEDIQFEIRDCEKIAVVGRNGCGKTTLLKIIAGEESLDRGTIHKDTKTTKASIRITVSIALLL